MIFYSKGEADKSVVRFDKHSFERGSEMADWMYFVLGCSNL